MTCYLLFSVCKWSYRILINPKYWWRPVPMKSNLSLFTNFLKQVIYCWTFSYIFSQQNASMVTFEGVDWMALGVVDCEISCEFVFVAVEFTFWFFLSFLASWKIPNSISPSRFSSFLLGTSSISCLLWTSVKSKSTISFKSKTSFLFSKKHFEVSSKNKLFFKLPFQNDHWSYQKNL